jgi:hypothetical protein
MVVAATMTVVAIMMVVVMLATQRNSGSEGTRK